MSWNNCTTSGICLVVREHQIKPTCLLIWGWGGAVKLCFSVRGDCTFSWVFLSLQLLPHVETSRPVFLPLKTWRKGDSTEKRLRLETAFVSCLLLLCSPLLIFFAMSRWPVTGGKKVRHSCLRLCFYLFSTSFLSCGPCTPLVAKNSWTSCCLSLSGRRHFSPQNRFAGYSAACQGSGRSSPRFPADPGNDKTDMRGCEGWHCEPPEGKVSWPEKGTFHLAPAPEVPATPAEADLVQTLGS